MKRLFTIQFLAALFFVGPVSGAKAVQDGALTAEYQDALLATSEASFFLNEVVLEITEKASEDLIKERQRGKLRYEEFLEAMVADLRPKINAQAKPEEIISAMNKYLFEEKGFGVDRSRLFEGSLDSLMLSQVLDNKKGNCLSLSLIYLLVAERLDLPISGVMIPGHFFVRYEKDGHRINIETTDKGKVLEDNAYRKGFGRYIDDEIESLSKKEVAAVYLANLANYYKLQGNEEKAITILQNVAKVIPRRASVYVNLGNAYERSGDVFKAVVYYQKALSLDKYLCEAHYNLGLIHFLYTNMWSEARRSGSNALKLGCRVHPQFKAFLDKN